VKPVKKKSIFSRILLFINFFAVIALLMVYLGVRIRPDIFWPMAFPGLFYPVILLFNIFFILIWLIRMKIYFLISLVTILLGWNHFTNFVRFGNTNRELPQEGRNISILSYNVRVFDLYNYGPKWEHNFTNRNNILRLLEDHDFDIICFQEFVHDSDGSFKTLDTIPSLIRAKYSHTGYTQESKNINFFGLATFSSFPIINKGRIDFPSQMGNLCIYSDIKVDKDTIRVYNVHFESIGLGAEDYLFVENLTNTEHITDHVYFKQNSLRIMKRVKNAFVQRTEQIEMVAEHITHCPYPVVLAGDFNDTPASWAHRQLTKNLNDAFKSGRGIGQTYVGNIPGIRIDYILHSDEFTPYNFTRGKEKYSDHYPIWVWLNLTRD
jgi:endonuclease/exonuclease/phosphatase family metal-dependent hydrolase